MKVIDIARSAGVTPETVRHYTREGLLAPARNPENGYHLYNRGDLNRLGFIQKARQLGFGIADIREILSHSDHGDSPCPLVRDMLEHRLPEIHQQIQELQTLATRIEAALTAWSDMPDGVPDGHSICRLIESFPENSQ